ncbi:UDP-glycosyltransferase UGT5 [Drosophila santomea]|uniref:UDP-glycosyltransferase UGT5 n=1 Tax=Drosophila santomea TaxID=129105 RepID=UPI001952F460|nr:UDP-glycosyltransferase UGT5 [Drosophila santomea]
MFPSGRWLVPIFWLISNWICWIRGSRILVIAPFDTYSQCMLVTPYIQALQDRGHQLTVIHAYKHCMPQIENVTFIRIWNNNNTYAEFEESMVIASASNKWEEISTISKVMANVTLNVLTNVEVRALMHAGITFDVVVLEAGYSDVLYGMAAHFNATLIGICTCVADWNINNLVGYTTSTLTEPIVPFGVKSMKNIWDRIYNWFYTSEEWLLMNLVFLPTQRLVHDHFFGHLEKSFLEIRQDFALMLLNQHFSLFRSRPNVPGMVEVAGLHIPKEDPQLPSDLQVFIDEAEHGVILFSLGLEQHIKDLPMKTQVILVETFKSIPQRVIWKFDGESTVPLDSSIYHSSLLPQQAILAHPNVKLFITHCGIMSVIEAAYYATPVLGLPSFYDQFINLEVMKEEEAALELNINSLTVQELKDTVESLINQPKYRENALAISQRFRDQLMHPMDTAIYWTEYIIRYKGANHMKVSRSQLKLFEYYFLDNFIMVGMRLFLVVAIVFVVLSKSRRWLNHLSTKSFLPYAGIQNNKKAIS